MPERSLQSRTLTALRKVRPGPRPAPARRSPASRPGRGASGSRRRASRNPWARAAAIPEFDRPAARLHDPGIAAAAGGADGLLEVALAQPALDETSVRAPLPSAPSAGASSARNPPMPSAAAPAMAARSAERREAALPGPETRSRGDGRASGCEPRRGLGLRPSARRRRGSNAAASFALPRRDRGRHLGGVEDGALQQRHLLQRRGGRVVARIFAR